MKYRYRLLYKSPIEEQTDDPDTWRKVFYISKYDCPSELDLSVKITELKKLYKMKDEYIILEDLENKNEYIN